jgi:hypothetical protein
MSVTVGEILAAARGGHAALTSEMAGYLVLGAADRLAQASGASFEPADIELDERGMVAVPGVRPAARNDAGALLRSALRDLLSLAPPGAAGLSRIARGSEESGAQRLVSEIEAALIPVNRAAARRALARLHRDVTKARDCGGLAPAPVAPPLPAETQIASPAPAEIVPVIESASIGTPVVLPPVEVRPPDDAPGEAWQSLPAQYGESAAVEPEATPFLGSWPVAARDTNEPDTDLAPPVAIDDVEESALVEPQVEAPEPTQIQFVAVAVSELEPIPVEDRLVEESQSVIDPT